MFDFGAIKMAPPFLKDRILILYPARPGRGICKNLKGAGEIVLTFDVEACQLQDCKSPVVYYRT
jgi:hypothetical protein